MIKSNLIDCQIKIIIKETIFINGLIGIVINYCVKYKENISITIFTIYDSI